MTEIVVTGASGHVGRALARRIDFRAVGRDDDLAAAVRDARVAVQLAGSLLPRRKETYECANADTARALAEAITAGSNVRRIVLLSYADAGSDPSNAYLASKARAERLLADTGRDIVVVRAAYIYGPPGDVGRSFEPYLAADDRLVTVIGSGRQLMAPVHVDAVVDAITRACEDDAPTGTFSLAGPETLTLDEMIDRINGREVRKRHIPPSVARVLAHLSPKLTPTLVDVLLRDCLPHDPPFPVTATV